MLGTIETTIDAVDADDRAARHGRAVVGVVDRGECGGAVPNTAAASRPRPAPATSCADDFVRVGQRWRPRARSSTSFIRTFRSRRRADGIANLRGQTGAPLFHLQSNTEPGLSRMARETSGYYVATFDPDPKTVPARRSRASIKTTREGVEVRGAPVCGRGPAGPCGADRDPPRRPPAMTRVRHGPERQDVPGPADARHGHAVPE